MIAGMILAKTENRRVSHDSGHDTRAVDLHTVPHK
jgi:hypothetical protein